MADEMDVSGKRASKAQLLLNAETQKAIKKTLTGQNFQQNLSLLFSALFELYKALTASMLIIFVTQECSGGECTVEENFHTDDSDTSGIRKLYQAGLAFNFTTLSVFMVLYLLEIAREQYLIEYMEENPDALFTNEAVGKALTYLDIDKLATILLVEKWYKRVGGVAIVMYLTNIIVSAVVIQHYSVGFYTWISFLTLTLFIAKKFIGTYFLIQTETNVYLSAYMTNPLQYNDVDPEHLRSEPEQDV
jgi:hypothetical protein